MKHAATIIALLIASAVAEDAIDPEMAANMILLKPIEVENLGIELEQVSEENFETTVFAIGRIEEIPANRSVLSSRISGRAVEVNVFEGDRVTKGQVLVRVESRQPGSPPPTIPLKAPRSGLVIASHVRLGEPVEPDTEMLDISDRSEVWAIAKIPENEAAAMQIGMLARIVVHAVGEEPILAELTRFGIEADRQAGTVDGIFKLSNPGRKLQPGMRAEFSIITATREEVMAVPREAVQGDPAKRVVYVADFDLPNVYHRSPVVLGEQNDQYIEVIRGLFPGDEVVTTGSYSLGFTGSGSVSLKDALDAAHGHEHNEDGSEITPEQLAAKEAEKKAAAGENNDGSLNRYLLIYAAVMTLLFAAAAQFAWSSRKKPASDA